MARVRELVMKRDQDIKEAYLKIKNEKKYTNEYIFSTLSQKFYLSPRTVEDIVYLN